MDRLRGCCIILAVCAYFSIAVTASDIQENANSRQVKWSDNSRDGFCCINVTVVLNSVNCDSWASSTAEIESAIVYADLEEKVLTFWWMITVIVAGLLVYLYRKGRRYLMASVTVWQGQMSAVARKLWDWRYGVLPWRHVRHEFLCRGRSVRKHRRNVGLRRERQNNKIARSRSFKLIMATKANNEDEITGIEEGKNLDATSGYITEADISFLDAQNPETTAVTGSHESTFNCTASLIEFQGENLRCTSTPKVKAKTSVSPLPIDMEDMMAVVPFQTITFEKSPDKPGKYSEEESKHIVEVCDRLSMSSELDVVIPTRILRLARGIFDRPNAVFGNIVFSGDEAEVCDGGDWRYGVLPWCHVQHEFLCRGSSVRKHRRNIGLESKHNIFVDCLRLNTSSELDVVISNRILRLARRIFDRSNAVFRDGVFSGDKDEVCDGASAETPKRLENHNNATSNRTIVSFKESTIGDKKIFRPIKSYLVTADTNRQIIFPREKIYSTRHVPIMGCSAIQCNNGEKFLCTSTPTVSFRSTGAAATLKSIPFERSAAEIEQNSEEERESSNIEKFDRLSMISEIEGVTPTKFRRPGDGMFDRPNAAIINEVFSGYVAEVCDGSSTETPGRSERDSCYNFDKPEIPIPMYPSARQVEDEYRAAADVNRHMSLGKETNDSAQMLLMGCHVNQDAGKSVRPTISKTVLSLYQKDLWKMLSGMDERAKEVYCLETITANVSNLVSMEEQLDFLTSKLYKKRSDSRIMRGLKRILCRRRKTIRQIETQLEFLQNELNVAKQRLEETQEIYHSVQEETEVIHTPYMRNGRFFLR